MSDVLTSEGLDLIFRNARTHNAWLDKPVEDTLLNQVYDLAARALGLDCGPMSGFDNAAVDAEFFAGTTVKSNFLCNLGYGDASKLYPRSPRLNFNEACKVL